MDHHYNMTQTMRNKISMGHKKRDNRYLAPNESSHQLGARSRKGSSRMFPNGLDSSQQTYQMDEMEGSDYQNDLILCKTLVDKTDDISIFPKNKKNMKKWAKVKSSISMYQSFQYDRRKVLASGFGYEVIKGFNKVNGMSKIIKIINCEVFGGVTKAKNVISQELNIHRTLENSDCVLKLEQVFEASQKIYMIYEEGTIMDYHYINKNLNKEEVEGLILNVLIALVELNSLGLAMGYISPKNIIFTNGSYINRELPEFKLFNFSEVFKYGKKYQLNRDDRKIGMGSGDKKVNSKTDSRCLGSFMAILYQRFSQNLASYPINKQYVRLLQTDPGLTKLEKDFIHGLVETRIEFRPDIKDMIFHELYFSSILKSKHLQQKVTSTLYRSKSLNYKRLEARLRDIASGRVDPAQMKKKGYLSRMGSFFTGKSQSKSKREINLSNLDSSRTQGHRKSRNFSQPFLTQRPSNGALITPQRGHVIPQRPLTPNPTSRYMLGSQNSRNMISFQSTGKKRLITHRKSSNNGRMGGQYNQLGGGRGRQLAMKKLPQRKKKGFFGNLFGGFLCCTER